MTTTDIADALAAKHGIGKAEARRRVVEVFDAIAEGLATGEVALAGFGKFATAKRGPRQGRNPRTGAPVAIGPSTRIGFKPAKALKDRVAG